MTRRVLASLIGLALVLVGCGGDSVDDDDSIVTLRIVPPTEVHALLDVGGVTLLDVRTPTEFTSGHIADATLIDFQRPDFVSRITKLPRDAKYVIYCARGGRSEQASKVMQDLGFTNIVQIEGGLTAWTDAGLPVES